MHSTAQGKRSAALGSQPHPLQDLADLRQLPWQSLPTRELAQASLALGLDYQIAAYDAAYVVLAESVKVPLVTADEKLLQRLVDTDCDVRWLGDWPR